jgi:hypothetical protein
VIGLKRDIFQRIGKVIATTFDRDRWLDEVSGKRCHAAAGARLTAVGANTVEWEFL